MRTFPKIIFLLFICLSCTSERKNVSICFRELDISLGDDTSHINSLIEDIYYEKFEGDLEGIYKEEISLGLKPASLSIYMDFNEGSILEYISFNYLWFKHENSLSLEKAIKELEKKDLPCINEAWEVLHDHIPCNWDRGQYEIFMDFVEYDEYFWGINAEGETEMLPASKLVYEVKCL